MSSQGESGVLLSDVGPGGDDASALAHRLEEAAATGQVQVVSAAEGDLRFRDAECVSDFLTGQRRFSRQARGSDIALVGSEVSLGGGRRGAGQTRFALNRIIGAHVGVTSSGTLFLSFAVHQSQAATHHACVSVHVVFRDSSESGSKSGGASKDDADVDALPALQSSRKVWETWVANLQVRTGRRQTLCLCLLECLRSCLRSCPFAPFLLFAHSMLLLMLTVGEISW